MARTDTLSNFLTDVADSIRNKKGTTDTILASNFDTEIESIESGGDSVSVTTYFTINDFTQINATFTYDENEMLCTVAANNTWGGVRLNELVDGEYHLKLTNSAAAGQRIWYMYQVDDTYMYVLCIGSGDGQQGIRYKLSKTSRSAIRIDKLTFPYTPSLNDVLNIYVTGTTQTIKCNNYILATLTDCNTLGASVGNNADNSVPFSVFSDFYRITKKEITLQSKEIIITENGTQTITPDEGYDGLSDVGITTNVSGGGTVPEKGFVPTEWDSDGYVISGDYYGDSVLTCCFGMADVGDYANIFKNILSVNFKDDIKVIPNYCFKSCVKLSLTELPSNVNSIGDYAFAYCKNLALTELPIGITSIGNNAFEECSSLILESLPSGITSIGSSAFINCSKLALTSLPDSLTSIGNYAFRYCSKLALTSLPDSLTSIGLYAFYNCQNIAITSLPDSLTSVSDACFYGCYNIKKISMNNVTKTGSTYMNGAAFGNCNALKQVWIGSSITPSGLGQYSFNGCSNLEKMYINLPRATVEAFANYQYAFMNDTTKTGIIVCNDDEGFITKEEFDALVIE